GPRHSASTSSLAACMTAPPLHRVGSSRLSPRGLQPPQGREPPGFNRPSAAPPGEEPPGAGPPAPPQGTGRPPPRRPPSLSHSVSSASDAVVDRDGRERKRGDREDCATRTQRCYTSCC